MRIQDVTAARGMLAATLGRLTSALDNQTPSALQQRQFTDYLTDAARRGAGTEELQHQIDQLLTVLADRTAIEQSKGMLMATQHINADTAYTLLREESQYTNVKLRDIAAHYIAIHSAAVSVPPEQLPPRSLDHCCPTTSAI